MSETRSELKDRLRADLTSRDEVAGQAADRDTANAARGDPDRGSGGQRVARAVRCRRDQGARRKEAKKRAESAEIYTQNGRGELAANEHAEARVIDEYLPTPLTEAEVADVVDTAIAQVAEEIGERPGMKQMGQVMKAATAIAAGKADGARLSAAVKARL